MVTPAANVIFIRFFPATSWGERPLKHTQTNTLRLIYIFNCFAYIPVYFLTLLWHESVGFYFGNQALAHFSSSSQRHECYKPTHFMRNHHIHVVNNTHDDHKTRILSWHTQTHEVFKTWYLFCMKNTNTWTLCEVEWQTHCKKWLT